MNNTIILRKSVLTLAGLTFAGAMASGPMATTAETSSPAAKMVAATAQAEKPSPEKLTPNGVQGKQSKIDLSEEQKANAKAIVETTKKNGLDERAAVIAIATALQESKLENLGHLGDRNDHDSQGLFQQRPSSGWGTVDQITDPEYSTTAFLKGLKEVKGWKDLPLTVAAQKVQVSAYPDKYAQWETQAGELVAEFWKS